MSKVCLSEVPMSGASLSFEDSQGLGVYTCLVDSGTGDFTRTAHG